jgi:RNA polymerase sigma factor for flagellar operon FliA
MNEVPAMPDTSARDALVLEHLAWARSIALHLSRYFPPSVEPDDLVQSAYLGLMTAAERFEPSRGIEFRLYARAAVAGAVMNSCRNGEYRQATAQEINPSTPDTSPSPERRVHDAEVRQALCEWLSMLPEREREVLILHYFDQATLCEIAQERGYHPSRISQLHQGALRELRAEFRRRGVHRQELIW